MMRKCVESDRTQVNRIFWGLILIHFHLNIGRFDLLPDCVGYVLLCLAIDGLAVDVPEYHTPKLLAILLAGTELMAQIFSLCGIVFDRNLIVVLWNLSLHLLNAVFDYRLFGCLLDTAEVYRLSLRRESLTTVRTARLVCNLLGAAAVLLPNVYVQSVIAVIGVALAIWSCAEVHGLSKELEDYGHRNEVCP